MRVEYNTPLNEEATNALIKDLECLVKELKGGKARINNYEQEVRAVALPSGAKFMYTPTSHVNHRFSGASASFNSFTVDVDKV